MKTIHQIIAGRPFWYCNLFGWIAFIILDSTSVYLHNHDFYGQLPHSIFTATLGILLGLIYRYASHKYQLYTKHPLSVVPASVLLAIIFGYLISTLDYVILRGHSFYESVIGIWFALEKIYWFPFLISQWIGTSYLLLIWLLLFNLIQSERYNHRQIMAKASWPSKILAVICIYGFIEWFHILVVIAYSPEFFLFPNLLGDNFFTLITGVAFAALVLIARPQTTILDSRLIAAFPGLIFIVFCSSFFCMICFSLLPYLDSLWQVSITELPQQIVSSLTTKGQFWLDKHQFIGTLHSQLQIQTLVVLIYLYFVHLKSSTDKSEFDGKKIDGKQEWLFWLYNMVGWSVLSCYLYFSDLLNWESVSSDFARNMLLSLMLGGMFAGLVIRSIIHHYQLIDSRFTMFVGKSLILSLLLGVLLTGGLWLTGYVLAFASEGTKIIQQYEGLVNANDFFIPVIAVTAASCFMWILIYEKSVSQRVKTQSQLQQLQMEANLKELQLNILSGKIDPHFIFNALNNIRALIREDSEKAREAILVLSDILRRPLTTGDNKIPLKDELAMAHNYLHLWKVQLENRLEYEEMIDSDIANCLIPPMFIQILMENAIKHGIALLPDGGKLTLRITRVSETLDCLLINTGYLNQNSQQPGFGFGLSNIQERLALLYNHNANITLQQDDLNVVAHLVLPLEFAR